MIKIAICDDDELFCNILEGYIISYSRIHAIEVSIVVYYSGEKLIKDFENLHYYDLILLDIELKQLTGVDVGLALRERLGILTVEIVYISSHTEYALKLFQVQPMDLLVKPISEPMIFKTMDQFCRRQNILNKTFTYKIGWCEERVPLNNIIYFKSNLREMEMFLVQEKSKVFYGSFKEVQEQLRAMDAYFFRPHKSYIVNYRHVKEFFSNYLILSNGESIPISSLRKKEVYAIQQQYERDER